MSLINNMKLENTTEDQMASSPFCFFNKPSPWILALVLSIIFSIFHGFGFLSILFTSLVLIISTLLFTFKKQKPVTEDRQLPEINESFKPQKEEEQEEQEVEHQIHDYSIKSLPDFLSESESLNQLSSSEESEVDWPYRDIVDCSEGSISDEESDLIEISLPSGHYVPNKFNLQQNKMPADFSTHSLLKQQHSLMELLAEINDMNEEENLIEIDISAGSIKCSRFEIEA